MRAVIFGGGCYNTNLSEYIKPDDFIVCADSGYDHALRFGYKPHLVIGDMDSISSSIEPGTEVITVPVQKDETDSMLCVDILAQRGYDQILFFGALGGRADHSFANICLLMHATKKSVDLKIIHENSIMFVTDKKAELCGNKGDLLSLFPVGGMAQGITTQGLFYPLCGETLYPDATRGTSNEFVDEKATVSLSSGYLLVIHTKIGGEKNDWY